MSEAEQRIDGEVALDRDPDQIGRVGGWWERRVQIDAGNVSFPARTIELVVIPYDVPALVRWQGRMVKETVSPGAFDGIERRANRIKANRDHDETRTFGRALSLHPSREEGLVAVIRASRTRDGDEALEYCADGVLEASAGFLPKDGLRSMKWQTRSAYRVDKAWLGHIALVPEGAYGDGARVLAVRHNGRSLAPASKTPNLDLWRAQEAEQRLRAVVASDPALR